jgi:hypothetical protein
LEENMAWLAESLGTKGSETPIEAIRRYIAQRFFKDHLQTYKKRPIYWLFSSGKQGAFQALVYLHRYHEGTLARLRAEYVVPLTGKIQSRIQMLKEDAIAASSTAARNKLAKEVEKLKKKHVELLAYDEQLRHYADMRITLDLDDGVKLNYGKFGDLLNSVKAVTGGAGEDLWDKRSINLSRDVRRGRNYLPYLPPPRVLWLFTTLAKAFIAGKTVRHLE